MGTSFGTIAADARRWKRSLCAVVAVLGAFLIFQPTAHAAARPQGRHPIGKVDVVRIVPGGYGVAGWTFEPNNTRSLNVHVYVNGVFVQALLASEYRPDVEAAHPGHGEYHGFEAVYESKPGTFDVCVYGISPADPQTNVRGENSLLGCKVVTVPGDPFGSFDVGAMAPGGTRIAGWAIDAQTEDPIAIHAYVDNVFTGAFEASVTRSDIGVAFPDFGEDHGFDELLAIAPGPHTVCVYGINDGAGANALIGCRSLVVSADPIGKVDRMMMSDAEWRFEGWALDPDTDSPLMIHVYLDKVFAGAFEASAGRSDIATAYPGYGEAHGFDVVVPTGGVKPSSVEIYGINQGTGTNSLLYRAAL